jgi:hypothetical protein
MRLFGKKELAACPQNLTTAPPSDADQVRQKLSAVSTDIAAAEAELRQASLAAALSDDPDAGYDAIARLNQLQGRKALLQSALQAAEQAERDRAAAFHAREWQARKRSLAQKAGQLDRDAADVAKASKALHEAQARMVETAAGIGALLPRQLRTPARPWMDIMAPMFMRQLGLLELWRLDPTAQKPDKLANYYAEFQNRRTGEVKSITSIIAELAGNLKTEFDRCGPVAVAAAPAAPVVQEGPAKPESPANDDYTVDLRGKQLGLAPEVAGTPEPDPAADTTPSDTPQPAPAPMPSVRYFGERE